MRRFTVLLLVLVCFSGCAILRNHQLAKLYPKSKTQGEIVVHQNYRLAYSETHEGALWVQYKLNADMLNGQAQRKDNFRRDPKVTSGSASPDDYRGSGYDRGHLCPAASMLYNQQAMDETFYMSNMAPQVPGLNRGRWKTLEEQEREWTAQYGKMHVVTGPVYRQIIETIGENKIAVPAQYYKIIWNGSDRIIAFLMPNQKCENGLKWYAIPVDSVEVLTGFNFFSIIPNKIENDIEAIVDFDYWFPEKN